MVKNIFYVGTALLFILACGSDNSNKNSAESIDSVRVENETSKTMEMKVEIEKKALTGEGAIWNHLSNTLVWLDIDGKMLYEYNPATKENKEFELPMPCGTVVPIDSSNVVLALADGIYTFNLQTKELNKKADNPDKWRFNDGKCDPQGRLWVGTLETEQYSRPLCKLYRVDSNYTVTEKHDSVIISNGIIWSLDGTKVYYTDSPRKKIVSFDFDGSTGEISNMQDCIVFDPEMGDPDGNTIDAEGNLWVAIWNGGCIVKCNPETGEIIEKYTVPAHNITSLAFGGENLETLFITTASNDMTDEEKSQFPKAGSVFSFKPGVKGVKASFFKPMEN